MIAMKIRKRLGLFLLRWPLAHRIAVSISLIFSPVHIKELFIGTRAWEEEWAGVHLTKRNDWGGEGSDVIQSYRDSIVHPHRQVLIDKTCEFSPGKILEIGCNCGPNLYLLAQHLPTAQLYGIDVNPMAIEIGSQWFSESGINNISLNVGKADDLGQFPDNSFDVVFTDALLIFVGPDKIEKVIEEMFRVARKGLLLTEWHIFEHEHHAKNSLGIRQHGMWKRDYTALLKKYSSPERVTITKITEDIWPDMNWQTAGAFIQVFKKLRPERNQAV